MAAAERADALLVTLENLYGYGSSGGQPMTEDHALAATTVKGRTRASMTRELLAKAEAGEVRIAIGRARTSSGREQPSRRSAAVCSPMPSQANELISSAIPASAHVQLCLRCREGAGHPRYR